MGSPLIRNLITRFSRRPEPVTAGIPKRAAHEFLPARPVIIDAGAHVGDDTVEMSRLWRKASIHAFEPVPHVYERLVENTRRLPGVRCYPLALSDACGTAAMNVSGGTFDGSSSLLPPALHLTEHPTVTFGGQTEARTMTLDAWAEEYGVPRVDFLWLDMQGNELRTLKASPRILGGVSAVHMEVFLIELYQGAPLYEEERTWMESVGFRVVAEHLPWRDAGNVLFARA